MGIFSTRIIREFERLEAVARPGVKVEVKVSERVGKGLDDLTAKVKAGGQLDDFDRAVLKGAVRELMTGLPVDPATGKTSLTAIRNMQRSYSQGVLVEFGQGNVSREALQAFRDGVTDAMRDVRAETAHPFKADRTARLVNDQIPRDVNPNHPRAQSRAADAPARAQETARAEAAEAQAAQRAAGQQNTAAGPQPTRGPASNQPAGGGLTGNQAADADIAGARAARETERLALIKATFGARGAVTDGIRDFEQGGFAAKKAAYDKVAGNIEGSGLIKQASTAQEVEAMARAGNSANRSIEEVKGILKLRVTQDADEKFINGVITVGEWDTLRKSMRTELLQAEQQEVFKRLDQARIGNRKIDTVSRDMDRLREIMLDPDFNPVPQRAADGSIVPGSDRMSMSGRRAAETGKPRSSYSDIESDLRAGKPVDPAEIDRLTVHYRRFYATAADQAADAAPPGRVGQVVDAISRGTRAVFNPIDRHLDRVPLVPRLAPTVGILAGTVLGTGAISVPVTYFAPDNEIPIMGEMGRRVATNLPFGLGGNVDGASWLPEIYFSKMEGNPEYRKQVLEGDPSTMNASKLLARSAQQAKTGEEVKTRGELEQTKRETAVKTTAADAVAGIQSLGSGTIEAGAKLEDIDAAVIGLAAGNNAVMSIDQMTKLATAIATASKSSGAVDILSPQEYASVKQDAAYTGLPQNAQKQLDAALAPLMPKP